VRVLFLLSVVLSLLLLPLAAAVQGRPIRKSSVVVRSQRVGPGGAPPDAGQILPLPQPVIKKYDAHNRLIYDNSPGRPEDTVPNLKMNYADIDAKWSWLGPLIRRDETDNVNARGVPKRKSAEMVEKFATKDTIIPDPAIAVPQLANPPQ
jgi:hypothetical protein